MYIQVHACHRIRNKKIPLLGLSIEKVPILLYIIEES